MSFIVCTCTVPSSPPEKVRVIVVNSTTLTVSFSPPPIIDQNGKLTGYVIRYNGEVGSGDIKSVTSTTTNLFLSRLNMLVSYSVTVAAVNGNGTGPFSNPVMQRPGIIGYQIVTLQSAYTLCI